MAIVFPASPSVNETFTAGSITYKWDGDKWIGLGVTPADRLIEGSNSLEIDANNNLVWTGNNVGVKTSSPGATLHLNEPSSSLSTLLLSGTAANATSFEVRQGIVGSENGGFSLRDVTTAGNPTRFGITASGNFGFNIASPTNGDLFGTPAFTINGTEPRLNLNQSADLDANGTISTLAFTANDPRTTSSVNGREMALIKANWAGFGNNNLDTDLSFYLAQAGTGASANERIRIRYNGVVKIGGSYTNDNGSRNLEVIGTDSSKAGILIGNTAVSATGTCDLTFAPSNTIAGAQIICEAKEDFSVGANRTADLKFTTRQDGTLAETARMTSAGYFTVPRQPSFRAGRSTSYTPGPLTDIIFNVTNGTYHHNNGGHYSTSNGRFTAPVAGMYIFTAHIIWQSLADGQAMDDAFDLKVNGNQAGYSFRRGEYVNGTTGNGGYYTDFGTYEIYLEANEYVTARNRLANLQVHGNEYYTTFSGCLIC